MAPDAAFVRRLLSRRKYLVGGMIGVIAVTVALLLSGGGTAATASPSSAAPTYSALASAEPSGLPLVSSHSKREAGDPVGPTFPVQPPREGDENWPVISSIRRLHLEAQGLSAWIARSVAGGVCVILYDGVSVEGVSPVDLSCSSPEGLERGASVEVSEIPGEPGEVVAVGVVPDGVDSVSQTMADGSTSTTPVVGNAWARVGDVAAAPGQEPTPTSEG
jgi:hypothetical protein